MRASIDPVIIGEPTGAIPVSPISFDFGELNKPIFTRRDRLRFLAIIALCLAAHAALLLLLEPQPDVTQVEEAIPVEVIFEPPPEEAPQPPEPAAQPAPEEEKPPVQQAQTIDEKPATDFARAADQGSQDGKSSEQDASKQKAAQNKEPEPARPDEKAAETQPATPPDPLPEPAPDPTPEALPEPKPEPPRAKAAPVFTGFTPLPTFEFKEAPAKRSEFARGNAEPGYLSTLYGLIMRKMPALPNQTRSARGRVTFGILSNGRIIQETISIPSGAPFLDAAALNAVRTAAPYPKPPKGGPVYIRFDYGSD